MSEISDAEREEIMAELRAAEIGYGTAEGRLISARRRYRLLQEQYDRKWREAFEKARERYPHD